MKKFITIILALSMVLAFAGCTEAERVSANLSQEADNFNVVRQLTVINGIQGDVVFQMTGKMSIQPDVTENQLEVIVEDENGNYKKQFVGLSDNTLYVLEQLDYKDVEKYKFTINYNPKMWIPVNFENID